jgi:AraC-like DNA-binding protein
MAASPVGGRRDDTVDRLDAGPAGGYTEAMPTADMQTVAELEYEYEDLIAIRGISPRSKHPEVDSRMRIDSAIAEGFDDVRFTIDDVALAVGLSERRIRDIIAEDDESFRGEVLKLRMAKARWLIANSNAFTVDEIAYLCGYRCASTFAKRFRQATGATPRAWREVRRYSARRRNDGLLSLASRSGSRGGRRVSRPGHATPTANVQGTRDDRPGDEPLRASRNPAWKALQGRINRRPRPCVDG